MYSRYLAKGVICLSLGTLGRVYDVKDAFFIGPYTTILLTTIAKPSLAEKVLALVKAHADMDLEAGFDGHFFWKYDISHFVFNLWDRNILLLFWPCFGAYLDFVKAFEVLRLHIRTQYLIYTEASEFDAFLRYEANGIESLLVCNITEKSFWRVHMLKPIEYFWCVHATL